MKKFFILYILAGLIFPAVVIAEFSSIIDIPTGMHGDTIAVFFSGDGGWRKIDNDISRKLTSQGIYVVGVNSMKYFWKKRTPEETAKDLDSLINSYMNKTGRKRIILIGYSFGADILPLVINRLPGKTRELVDGVVFLGVSDNAAFEVSAMEWLGRKKGEYATIPEILQINDMPLLFIEGAKDDHTVIEHLDRKKHDVVFIEGGHHFDGDYYNLAQIIITWYKKNRSD